MAPKDTTPAAGMITTAQATKLLMITPQWLRQLAVQGYIPRAVKGAYPLVAVVQGYIKSLKDDEKRSTKTAADNRVRDARAAEIERRMAREDREIITLEEAMASHEDVTGEYLQSISGLPARITRNQSERRRIEVICDAERTRLATRFDKSASALRTGQPAIDADGEDDA